MLKVSLLSAALMAAMPAVANTTHLGDLATRPASAVSSADPHSAEAFLAESSEAPMEGTGYLLFKTLVLLGVVVAVIYLTLNVGARKLMKLTPDKGALVRIVERVAVEPKKSLYVVEVAGGYLLVGSSESGFSSLGTLDATAVRKQVEARDSAPRVGFAARLKALRRPDLDAPPATADSGLVPLQPLGEKPA